jgi:hypothetical protein
MALALGQPAAPAPEIKITITAVWDAKKPEPSDQPPIPDRIDLDNPLKIRVEGPLPAGKVVTALAKKGAVLIPATSDVIPKDAKKVEVTFQPGDFIKAGPGAYKLTASVDDAVPQLKASDLAVTLKPKSVLDRPRITAVAEKDYDWNGAVSRRLLIGQTPITVSVSGVQKIRRLLSSSQITLNSPMSPSPAPRATRRLLR